MAQLRLLTSDRPDVAGILFSFDSGFAVEATMVRTRGPLDVAKMSRDMAAQVLDALMREGRIREADGTRWPSVVAACGELIRRWISESGGGVGGPPLLQDPLTPSASSTH